MPVMRIMPGYKWPDLVIAVAIMLQIIISASLIIYFLTFAGACTIERCDPVRFISLPYFNEEQFIAKFATARPIYMFYNIFVPSAYAYLFTTFLMLLALLFRYREFMAFGAKALFLGFFLVYLSFLASTLLFPNSYIMTTQLQRGILNGETSGYLIVFCLFPLLSLFFGTAFSWKKHNNS